MIDLIANIFFFFIYLSKNAKFVIILLIIIKIMKINTIQQYQIHNNKKIHSPSKMKVIFYIIWVFAI